MSNKPASDLPAATLLVTSPSGHHSEVPLTPLPFYIGRLGDNHLVLRDTRISRRHARVLKEGGSYFIEDLGSRHGVFVNGARIQRHRLQPGDQISFGFSDSYLLTFMPAATSSVGLLAQAAVPGGQLARLRATLEVARALQASLSTDEVLAAVVEAALIVTGAQRGFLLLKSDQGLAVRVARDRNGPLPPEECKLPLNRFASALNVRRQLLAIEREALGGGVAVPLVRIRTGRAGQTAELSPAEATIGLLYMEAGENWELPAGSDELLASLALEASTVLENARLLEEQWARQRMEEELRIARRIQQSLLPRHLPARGWLRAAAGSIPSREVSGDYYDLRPAGEECWVVVMADVAGKGVGAALLAALLQGMLVVSAGASLPIEQLMSRANQFLLERTGGEQYATLFYGVLEATGRLRMVNAGHPPVLWLGRSGLRRLPAGAVPLGLFEQAQFAVEQIQLEAGDRLVLYTDGVTDARSPNGEFFGLARLEGLARELAPAPANELKQGLLEGINGFTRGSEQPDDITLLVLEYSPETELTCPQAK